MDFVFIAGAPGSGKSTVAQALQERLGSPLFEFAWIPEFRLPVPDSHAREEQLSFENLCGVIKNYVRHGYRNILITDLDDRRFREIPRRFQRYDYLIVTLVITDDESLKRRVLNESRSSGYRDWEAALEHNRKIMGRGLLRNEVRVDNTSQTVKVTVEEIIGYVNQKPGDRSPRSEGRASRLPPKDQFNSYIESG